MNTVVNHRFLPEAALYLQAETLSGSEEKLCSMYLFI
jgi:hypothetical protein